LSHLARNHWNHGINIKRHRSRISERVQVE
jgi:hypothetical protein